MKDGVQGCPGQSTRYGPRWVQRWQRRHAGPCHDDGGPGRRRVRRFCTRSDRMVHWQESDAWRSGASGAGCCPSPQSGANKWNGIDRHSNSARRPDLTPDCWLRKKTGSTDVFGRLWWDRPAYTIRTEFFKPEKGRYLHPAEHRPITLREAARCLSFPDDFVVPESQSMTSVARQIGNAVPPLMATARAEVIAEQLGHVDGARQGGVDARQRLLSSVPARVRPLESTGPGRLRVRRVRRRLRRSGRSRGGRVRFGHPR